MAEPEETIGLAEGQGSQSGGLPKPLRKRRRTVISCIECHRRKKKCDRLLPCSNCVGRKKESICHYENEDARKQQLLEDGANAFPSSREAFSASRFDATEIASFGYVEGGGNDSTTLEIVKMIEGYGADQSVLATPTQKRVDKNGLWEKYKRLVGKLPPNEYVEKLVAIYFREVNYQYYPLDEDIFRDHLQQWYELPLAVTSEQLLSLPSGLRFFPAVLFQMLALALLFQPPNYDRSFNSLKSTAGMSLDDLSGDYSESGSEISSLLGKRHTDLMAVQAGFLRTTYLKTCGFIPESWHSLSQTIRDAQEIGLHKGSRDCRGQGVETTIDILDRLWVEQLQRRMWGILALWDIHMAIILGRPSTIDNTDKGAILPIDAPITKNRRAIAPSPRTEDDPPTPLTALLWSIQLSAPLWDIYQLEKEGPSPLHISKVKKLHEDIIQVTHHCPPCLRSENPDTRFDSHPECYWLHYLRPNIQNETAFSLMALHRPYIFINTSSRTAALTAGLDILQAQRAFFDLIDVKDYKMSSLVIRTFDAIVVVAAIYILHPHEHRSQLHATLQHFEWAMERFQVLSRRNSMAKAGLGVLKGIYVRLKKALSLENVLRRPPPSTQPPQLPTYPIPPDASHSSMPFSTPGSQTLLLRSSEENTITSHTPGHDGFGPYISTDSVAKLNPASRTSPVALAWERFSENSQTLPDFDFSPIAPLQPMHDLIYNDLSVIADMQALDPRPGSQRPLDMVDMDTSGSWQFEGDFGTSSFWGFMNSYNP